MQPASAGFSLPAACRAMLADTGAHALNSVVYGNNGLFSFERNYRTIAKPAPDVGFSLAGCLGYTLATLLESGYTGATRKPKSKKPTPKN